MNLADGLEEWLEWVNLAGTNDYSGSIFADGLEEWLEWVNLAEMNG